MFCPLDGGFGGVRMLVKWEEGGEIGCGYSPKGVRGLGGAFSDDKRRE